MTYPWRWTRARLRTLRARRLHRAELRLGRDLPARADRTPIFILGAPRSGTTLLYQLLVEGLDVGWLANAHAASPSDAIGVERREQPRARRTGSDFESSHGTTAQPWGPSESGEYWYRFVPRRPHQLETADATPARVQAIRAAVRGFAAACAAPVVFKNVFNSLRVPVLARALPEARFVLIERDDEANARSLLAGRVRRGNVDEWWSAEPAGAETVLTDDATPAQQVVWQVRELNRVARRELDRLDPDRSLVVSYDELCADPCRTLERIHAWLVSSGSSVRRRAVELPTSFDSRGGGSLEPQLEANLQSALSSSPTTTTASGGSPSTPTGEESY